MKIKGKIIWNPSWIQVQMAINSETLVKYLI